ncbi:MAG: hypothetical protein DDT21_00119 [Syntrophomonadaceae bacterium]|nr:hypothetical protein [Bacillota bacterium]
MRDGKKIAAAGRFSSTKFLHTSYTLDDEKRLNWTENVAYLCQLEGRKSP